MLASSSLAKATLLGLSVLSQFSVPPPQAQLLVLDEFPSQPDQVSHGTLVEAILREKSQLLPERVQIALGNQTQELQSHQEGALDNFVTARFVVPLRATAEALKKVEGPAVASQSQGASESRVVETLWNLAQAEPQHKEFLQQELKLSGEVTEAEFLQALVHRVDEIHHHSQAIREARQQLLRAATEAEGKGLIRVLSAGNQGQLAERFETLGVLTDRDFYLSDLADPNAIIVAASDHHWTLSASDDGPAALASPHAGALLAAQGVEVPVSVHGEIRKQSGSSFAQPQVAALIAQWRQAEPSLTRDQIVERLLHSVRAMPGSESTIGAGILDLDWKVAA